MLTLLPCSCTLAAVSAALRVHERKVTGPAYARQPAADS